MSEHDVEAHMRKRRGEGEPPANAGEQTQGDAAGETPEVEGHMPKYRRGEAEPPPNVGERSEESEEADVAGHGRGMRRGEAEAPPDAGERDNRKG